jgi:hypothetical protein
MFNLPPSVRLFIAAQLVDGRKGPDSLITLVRDVLGQDIFDGHLSARSCGLPAARLFAIRSSREMTGMARSPMLTVIARPSVRSVSIPSARCKMSMRTGGTPR